MLRGPRSRANAAAAVSCGNSRRPAPRASVNGAQFRGGGRVNEGSDGHTREFRRRFNFCRIQFRQNGQGTATAGASTIRAPTKICQLACPAAKTPISRDETGDRIISSSRSPTAAVPVSVHDADRTGGAYFDAAEAAPLREYLLKGGFLWVDDFWAPSPGTTGQPRSPRRCRPVSFNRRPAADHRSFNVLAVNRVPQIPPCTLLGTAAGPRARRSQRVPTSCDQDPHGRVMVLMTSTRLRAIRSRKSHRPCVFSQVFG